MSVLPLLSSLNKQPHLFLDRDGTLIKECNYLRDPQKIVFEDDAIEGLKLFQLNGYRLVIISNQSGVARSIVSTTELQSITHRISTLLAEQGVYISSFHYCPHLPSQGCSCRKPSTALFHEANVLHPVDWSNSIMIGDKISDVKAGLAIGLQSVLITTGYGELSVSWAEEQNILVVRSLLELANLVSYK